MSPIVPYTFCRRRSPWSAQACLRLLWKPDFSQQIVINQSLHCPLHAFYIWNRAGMCVKLRRRHKFQEGPAERHKVPRAILVYGSLGAPASRRQQQNK
jgi:hypothetical protein